MDCKRLKQILRVSAAFAMVATMARPLASLPPVESLSGTLQAVESRYNRMKTVRMRFHQIYRQDSTVLREEEGTLYLRKPGQMRWEYEAPEPKLFLTDGKTLTLYLPEENRVTETKVNESGDYRTPLRFLLGQTRFAEEFQRIETSQDFPPLEKGNLLLKAFAKRLEDRLDWVLFEITPAYRIRRLVLQEPGEVQQEFRFEGEQPGVPLSQQLFQFEPPEGAQVIRE